MCGCDVWTWGKGERGVDGYVRQKEGTHVLGYEKGTTLQGTHVLGYEKGTT